jgi:adenylate cyclase class IV
MIEIKYRGPLTRNKVETLTKYLQKHGTLISSVIEEVVYFDTSIFPEVGDFITGFSRVSIKASKNEVVLRMKEGNPSDNRRPVVKVSVKHSESRNLLLILNRLGLRQGYYRPVFRRLYRLGTFKLAIKTKCIMGDHFELELPTYISVRHSAVQGFITKFDLQFWSTEQYQNRITKNMKASPAINVYESNIF